MQGRGPTHFAGPTIDADGQLIPFSPAAYSGYDASGFSHGPHHFGQAVMGLGPQQHAHAPASLPESGWRPGCAWQHAPLNALAGTCSPILDESGNSSSDNVTDVSSPHVVHPTRNSRLANRARSGLTSAGGAYQAPPTDRAASGLPLPTDIQIQPPMKSYMSQFPTTSTKRKSFTKERRQEVAETRKKGACFTCRMQKGSVGAPACVLSGFSRLRPGTEKNVPTHSVMVARLHARRAATGRNEIPACRFSAIGWI